LRGIDAARLTPPDWLMGAAAEVLEAHRSVESTAELAEALARHRPTDALVAKAVSATFNGRGLEDPDAAFARWWLASRQEEAARHLSTRAFEDAQLQALAAADPASGKAAAMVMEAAGRVAGELVISSPEALSAARSRDDRRARLARAVYRCLLLVGLLVLGLANLHDIAHWLSSAVDASNEHAVRMVLGGVFTAGLALCVSGTGNAVSRALGRPEPDWTHTVELLGTVAAGIIGAVIA
jgi:hypothetical protein